jgi:hypothetical protein
LTASHELYNRETRDHASIFATRKPTKSIFSCNWKNDANSLPLMFKFADGVHGETSEALGLVCAMPGPRHIASN